MVEFREGNNLNNTLLPNLIYNPQMASNLLSNSEIETAISLSPS